MRDYFAHLAARLAADRRVRPRLPSIFEPTFSTRAGRWTAVHPPEVEEASSASRSAPIAATRVRGAGLLPTPTRDARSVVAVPATVVSGDAAPEANPPARHASARRSVAVRHVGRATLDGASTFEEPTPEAVERGSPPSRRRGPMTTTIPPVDPSPPATRTHDRQGVDGRHEQSGIQSTAARIMPPAPYEPGAPGVRGGDSPPIVRVTIGRVEVRAVSTPAAPARRRAAATPKLSLDDYLAERSRKH